MPILRGNKVPFTLRARGIRWINPDGVRFHFKCEHDKWERGFRAGYIAAKGEPPDESMLKTLRNAAFVRHCHSAGFAVSELDSL